MKSKESSRPASFNPVNPINHLTSRRPRYSLRRHTGFWSLTFNGQEVCFDHEQGAYYVAYLLLNPPSEPIHGMALELKAHAFFGDISNRDCETIMTHPFTGEAVIISADAVIVQRNLLLDEKEGVGYLRRKVRELEAIMADETASEPVKAEVQRELQGIYAYEKHGMPVAMNAARYAVRAVRRAIQRFHLHLATAAKVDGSPDPILRQFAFHLLRHLIIPSARYSERGRARTKTGVAGCFTYEPPTDVRWGWGDGETGKEMGNGRLDTASGMG